jgi:tetratricopeptide (TPR) repeat protein
MMTCKLFCVTTSVCALVAASLLAQDGDKGIAVKEARQATERASQGKRDRDQDRQRYEEIEIMRRILGDGLRRVAHTSTGDGLGSARASAAGSPRGIVFADFDSDGHSDVVLTVPVQSPQDYHAWLGTRANNPHRAVPGIETVEGFYLQRHGVVYTAGLLVHYLETAKPSSQPAQKPLSEWERVRKEMRGEQSQAPSQRLTQARESLADALVRMLAENGHNFSSLAPDENVTVAVTLRQGMDCALCHKMAVSEPISHWKGFVEGFVDVTREATSGSGNLIRDVERQAANKGSSIVGKLEQAPTQMNRGRPSTEPENQALLGDLQMKQGRYKEAVEAYRKALEVLGNTADDAQVAAKLLQTGLADQSALQQQVLITELAAKLAQASLAGGDEDKTLKALEQLGASHKRIESLYKKILEKKDRAQSGQSAARNGQIELPAKLVVSARKRLLDQVGEGNISLADFKKAASIEFLTFPGTKSPVQAKP